jgi:hypothetical protein
MMRKLTRKGGYGMKSRSVLLLMVIGLMTLTLACSQEGPTESSPQVTKSLSENDWLAGPPDSGAVQIMARVATRDENQRMLTFMGVPDTVFALHNCEIVRLNNDGETPIPFEDIHPGDSLRAIGTRNEYEYQYVYAHKIAVCAVSGGPCDLAFRDTIATIDYGTGTFTVKGRLETITTDDETVIRGMVTRVYDEPQGRYGLGGNALADPNRYTYRHQDTLLEFTDLQEGDVVEVRANVVDETTLYAVMVRLPNCNLNERKCIEFEANLATIDVLTRIVTFTGLGWIGYVCPGAALTGPTGEEFTLDDFVSGDLVAVKGVPLEADTLKICEMLVVAE